MKKTCLITKEACYFEGNCRLLHFSTQRYDVYYCYQSIDHRMATGVAINKRTQERFLVSINLVSEAITGWKEF
jgi:hypothetical protein